MTAQCSTNCAPAAARRARRRATPGADWHDRPPRTTSRRPPARRATGKRARNACAEALRVRGRSRDARRDRPRARPGRLRLRASFRWPDCAILAVDADQLRQAAPDRVRALRQRQLRQRPALAAHAAVVHAARLRAAKRRSSSTTRQAAPAQEQRGRSTDDAAADDRDVGASTHHCFMGALGAVVAASRTAIGLTGAWPRRRPTSRALPADLRGKELRGGGAAHATLAAAHADARERLQAVDLAVPLSRTQRAQLARVTSSQRQTITSSGAIGGPVSPGTRKRASRPCAKRRDASRVRCSSLRAHAATRASREPRSSSKRQRRAFAGQFGRVRADDAGAVAGEVDAGARCCGRRRRASGSQARLSASKAKAAAGQIGELRLGAQAVAEADRVAVDRVFARLRASSATATRVVRPACASAASRRRCSATPCAQPADVVHALRNVAGCDSRPAQRASLAAERRRVEHGHDLRAGLRVLLRDEVQQRPGAGEHDARPIAQPCDFSATCAAPSV